MIIELIVIPIIALALGVILNFELRKIFARAQYRFGPLISMYPELRSLLGSSRLLQPLYDVLKLFYKKTIIPNVANKILFTASPIISLILAFISSYFISYGGLSLLAMMDHSLFYLVYLLILITFFWILGASASSSPWAVFGARREAELWFTIEVSMILSIFSTAIIADSSSISGIITYQLRTYPLILVNPIAAFVFILTILGKLHLKPFDIPDAEVEIVGGQFTEYSGKLLATIYLAKYVLTATLVGIFIDLFLSGGQITPNIVSNLTVFIILTVLVTFILALIHAAMPRFRIDQAFKWSIKILWPISILSVILSLIIKILG